MRRFITFIFVFSVVSSQNNLSFAQVSQQGFDDYRAFESDPIELDQEYQEYFGRFFQMSLMMGTGIFNGGLGTMNSAGFHVGARFVFYFDRIWAAELSGAWARHNSFLNQNNTEQSGIDVSLNTTLIPVQLGLRFAFDRDNLPRSIAMMNPYLAANAEIVFRSEAVKGAPQTGGIDASIRDKFNADSITNSTAFGAAFGGGLGFDVYRNKLMLGFDIRYHLLFWPDADITIGKISRRGHYVSILGTLTYNY